MDVQLMKIEMYSMDRVKTNLVPVKVILVVVMVINENSKTGYKFFIVCIFSSKIGHE